MMGGGWMWGHGWGWAGWLVMCVIMLLFWSGLIAATIAGIRYLAADRAPYRRQATTLSEQKTCWPSATPAAILTTTSTGAAWPRCGNTASGRRPASQQIPREVGVYRTSNR